MKIIKKVMALALCLAMLIPSHANAAELTSANNGGIESTGKIGDINLSLTDKDGNIVKNAPAPSGISGDTIDFNFKLTPVVGADIEKVYIYVDKDFAFETTNDVFENIEPEDGTKPVDVAYSLTSREGLKTDYYPVNFVMEYTKDGNAYVLVKQVHAKLEEAVVKEENSENSTTEEAAPDNSGDVVSSTPGVSTPRLIVTGYETSPATVKAGEDFKLTIHVKNTSKRTAVSNIKFTLSTTENEFLPKSGSSTVYVEKISSGKTEDLVIDMKAKNDLDQKPYVLTIASIYEDSSCTSYEATEGISIPIVQEARLTVSDLSLTSDYISLYEQANVMFTINNLGKGTLYNVNVSFEGDTVEADPSYVGNIAPGVSGYADAMVTGVAATEDDGIIKAIISYEDADGNVNTMEQEITLFVSEDMGEEEYYDDSMMMEEEQPSKSPLAIIGIVALVLIVIAIAIVVVVVIIIKKRKGKEEVDEDELS